MADSGKHSALRQIDDGSFELVVERSGLLEISEEEISSVVETPPSSELPHQPRTSPRVLILSVVGVAVVLLLGAIGWFALGSKKKTAEIEEVPGFRPYGGGPEVDAAPARPRPTRPGPAAFAAGEAEDEAVEGEVPEEITESEEGWELTEPGQDVIVEVEGTDPAATDPVAAPPRAEESAELPVGASSAFRSRGLDSRGTLKSLRDADIGKSLNAPRVPGLRNSISPERFRNLPVRSVDGESDGDTIAEQEVVEEEVVEEEVPVDDAQPVEGEVLD